MHTTMMTASLGPGHKAVGGAIRVRSQESQLLGSPPTSATSFLHDAGTTTYRLLFRCAGRPQLIMDFLALHLPSCLPDNIQCPRLKFRTP